MFTLVTLRDWIGDATASDSILTELEAAAVARVEQHLSVPLGAPGARTDVITGLDIATLYLPTGAATVSITSVKERLYAGGDETTFVAADYERRGGALIRRNGDVWSADAEYVVTVQAGYTSVTAPPLVRKAVLDLVALYWHARGSEDLQSESIGDYSYTRASASDGRDPADTILATLSRRVRV